MLAFSFALFFDAEDAACFPSNKCFVFDGTVGDSVGLLTLPLSGVLVGSVVAVSPNTLILHFAFSPVSLTVATTVVSPLPIAVTTP